MASRIPVSVRSRKTDPLIKCIIHNKLKKLLKLIGGRDINGLYSSEVWKDDVTPLTAASICGNEEICSYLLKKSADPNKPSTNGWTPLHYAALTGVPLSIVKRLLAANADPDGNEAQIFNPLQCAVYCDREDIVKALIEAGASPENNYRRHTELDKKVERMIHQLSSLGGVFEKVHLFFSLFCAVTTKNLTEVYSLYKDHFFQEHPFIHTILFEHYCVFSGQGADQYRQSATKWLKDTKSADRYIEGFIKRFPKLPRLCWRVALNCMYAVLCVSESITSEVFCDLVSILSNSLQHSGNAQRENINHLILKILDVMMQKTNKYLKQSICVLIILIAMMTYGLFAKINDITPKLVALFGLSSVPETILIKAEKEMDEDMKKNLQKLDDSLRNPAGLSAVDGLREEICAVLSTSKKKKLQQPFTQPAENSRRWHQTSGPNLRS